MEEETAAERLHALYGDELQQSLLPPAGPMVNRRQTEALIRQARRIGPAACTEPDATTWIWSDLHLGHEHSRTVFGRPFPTATAVDEAKRDRRGRRGTPRPLGGRRSTSLVPDGSRGCAAEVLPGPVRHHQPDLPVVADSTPARATHRPAEQRVRPRRQGGAGCRGGGAAGGRWMRMPGVAMPWLVGYYGRLPALALLRGGVLWWTAPGAVGAARLAGDVHAHYIRLQLHGGRHRGLSTASRRVRRTERRDDSAGPAVRVVVRNVQAAAQGGRRDMAMPRRPPTDELEDLHRADRRS